MATCDYITYTNFCDNWTVSNEATADMSDSLNQLKPIDISKPSENVIDELTKAVRIAGYIFDPVLSCQ